MSVGIPTSDEHVRSIIQGPGDTEWKYEMRRDCQEIAPGLWLGPFLVSKSLESLNSLGITHILCIRDAKEAFSVKPRFPEQFQYMVLDVQDNEDQNLIKLFPGAQAFIQNAIQAGGRVLVHCNGGISLSPAFAIMYVMQHYNINWEEALQLVQNRRYCISPNAGFLQQIKEYESIYKANVSFRAFASNSQTNRVVSRRKRSDDDDDDDEDMRMEDRKRVALADDGSDDDSDAMMA